MPLVLLPVQLVALPDGAPMTPEEAQLLATTAVDAPFWDGLGVGVVRLPACSVCETWVWPAQPVCPACHHAVLDWRDVDPVGVIHSWTRTWYPFAPTRQDDLPYIVVLAEIPGAGGARVLGVYAGPSDEDLAVGDAVSGKIAPPTARTYNLPSLTWVRDPSR